MTPVWLRSECLRPSLLMGSQENKQTCQVQIYFFQLHDHIFFPNNNVKNLTYTAHKVSSLRQPSQLTPFPRAPSDLFQCIYIHKCVLLVWRCVSSYVNTMLLYLSVLHLAFSTSVYSIASRRASPSPAPTASSHTPRPGPAVSPARLAPHLPRQPDRSGARLPDQRDRCCALQRSLGHVSARWGWGRSATPGGIRSAPAHVGWSSQEVSCEVWEKKERDTIMLWTDKCSVSAPNYI